MHNPIIPPAAALAVPAYRPVAEARAELDRLLVGAVADAASDTIDEPLRIVFRVSPGLGKTSTLLRALVRHGAEILGRGHVLIHVPTLELAERAAEEFAVLGSGLPHRVIRGRLAPRPGTADESMCRNAEIVKRIAGLVPSVTQAMCRARGEGRVVEAPCARGCPYMAQQDDQTFQIHFMAHSYLSAHPPIDPQARIALRVIDEKFWAGLQRTSRIPVDDFMRAPPRGYPAELHGELLRTKTAILDGLQRQIPLHDHLTASGIDSQLLIRLAAAEEELRPALDIRPWHPHGTVAFRLDTFDVAAFRSARQRQALFEVLAAREAGSCNRVNLREEKPDGRQVITIHRMADVPSNAPLVMLDADADEQIIDALVPGAQFVRLAAAPKANIVQVADRTVSNTWLLNPSAGLNRRRDIARIIGREVARAKGAGVLLIATRKVLAALHADAGQESECDTALRRPLHGAVPRWFGPSSHGVNDFEVFGTVIIIGRMEPPSDVIEDSARSIFGDDPTPIEQLPPGPLPQMQIWQLSASGALYEAKVRSHPDPRCAAVLQQLRECSAAQGVARLRLLAPDHPKRVLLVGNTPLPDLSATKLVRFEALALGLEDEPDLAGYRRLETALRADGSGAVRGTRLSAAGLAADLPRDFPTKGRAEEFRRGRPTAALIALIVRVATANQWPMTVLELHGSTGGKAIPAIVFATPGHALARARELWPDRVPQVAARPPPDAP